MRRLSKLRPSPAMVVAFVALFVAGAGGATAATSLIDGGDVKNNSLTSKDVKDRSLLRKDFKRGQIPAGPRGLQGPQGVVGPTGRTGRDGIDGFGQLVYSQGVSDVIPDTQTGGDVFAVCPDGTFPTGGDAFYVDGDGDFLEPQLPVAAQGIAVDGDGNPAAWFATPTTNTSGGDVQFVVDAICANASQLGFVETPQSKAKVGDLRPKRPAAR